MTKPKVETVAESPVEPTVPAPKIAGLAVGHMVHYVRYNSDHRPGIIVNVIDADTGVVNIQVFNDGPNDGHAVDAGVTWFDEIAFSDGQEPGTWHYIEYVP